MSFGFALERKLPEVEEASLEDSYAIARHDALDVLDRVATDLGVTPLTGFLRDSDEAMSSLLRGKDYSDFPIRWFEPADGLKSVSALLTYLKGQPAAVKGGPGVRKDLSRFEQVLRVAVGHGVRFHFSIDI